MLGRDDSCMQAEALRPLTASIASQLRANATEGLQHADLLANET